MLEPAVDWRKALAAELRRAVADTTGAVDYSYRRPSRRASVAGDVVLPALRRPVPDIAVVCDTSGSMSEDLLAMALAEVEGLLRAVGLARQLRVLACDTAVGPVRRVSSARQVELVGGGGTDMGAGIEAAGLAAAQARHHRGAHRRVHAVAGRAAAGHAGGGRPARRRRARRPGLGPGGPGPARLRLAPAHTGDRRRYPDMVTRTRRRLLRPPPPRARGAGFRLAVIAGVAGPVAFTAAWATASLLQAGHAAAEVQISGLAAPDARDPWIMITGFVVLGGCSVAFGSALHRELGGAGRAGPGPAADPGGRGAHRGRRAAAPRPDAADRARRASPGTTTRTTW